MKDFRLSLENLKTQSEELNLNVIQSLTQVFERNCDDLTGWYQHLLDFFEDTRKYVVLQGRNYLMTSPSYRKENKLAVPQPEVAAIYSDDDEK